MPRRVCPVYKEVRDLGPALKLQTANTGLVYDRYADIWSGPGGQWTPDQPKRGKAVKQQFLDEIVTHAAEARQGIAPWLQSFQERREKLWAATGATVVKLKPAAPLISGIGIAHPLEVGFVWDRNLGVPYLPATTLKGAAHAWARQWLGMPEDTRKRIFGDSSDDGGAGSVVFHSLYRGSALT